MQDIAGCRAILPDVENLEPFISTCRAGWRRHELVKEPYDYIAEPRSTGYRGVHLVYRFKSENRSFDGRLVEVQFRSRWQHAWATAVEIVDLFQPAPLKAGKGNPDWQRFFALMGSAIAVMESSSLVPDTPADPLGLENELRHYAELLDVEGHLKTYGRVAASIHPSFTGVSGYSGHSGQSGYFVIERDLDSRTIAVRGYAEHEAQRAYRDVADAEKKNSNVVLVAATDLESLKQAYPNWIIDTHNFIMILYRVLNKPIPSFP
jgi:hypothetical protein